MLDMSDDDDDLGAHGADAAHGLSWALKKEIVLASDDVVSESFALLRV